MLKNDKSASFEFGFPFNINSPDKSKSVISVAPYARFPYLIPVENAEEDDEVDKNDFQVGLRIGLPVHVGSTQK
jgi:hypothetical protein